MVKADQDVKCPRCGSETKKIATHNFSDHNTVLYKCSSDKCNSTIPVRVDK